MFERTQRQIRQRGEACRSEFEQVRQAYRDFFMGLDCDNECRTPPVAFPAAYDENDGMILAVGWMTAEDENAEPMAGNQASVFGIVLVEFLPESGSRRRLQEVQLTTKSPAFPYAAPMPQENDAWTKRNVRRTEAIFASMIPEARDTLKEFVAFALDSQLNPQMARDLNARLSPDFMTTWQSAAPMISDERYLPEVSSSVTIGAVIN